MAINIKEAYPANADSPSLEYTTGSFRNDSTPESEDGTPLEKGWANDLLGARDAILKQANITPSGDVETAEASDVLDALNIISMQNASSQNVVVFDTAGATAWTVPDVLQSGLLKAHVTVIGGGGGGGRQDSTAGGGGGGGGKSFGMIDLTGITSVTVTVGAGGLGRTASSGVGNSGSTSSFGAYMSATGGGGGGIVSGGDPGEGLGGDMNLAGGPGGQSSIVAPSESSFTGGSGGDGRGAQGQSIATTGRSANRSGGGGGGSVLGANGGNGYRGLVVVRW